MRSFLIYMFLVTGSLSLCSFYISPKPAAALRFPYHQAGLSDRQAAAHLLNRFSFGATPTGVDAVVKMGLEKWFVSQLQSNDADKDLQLMLSSYDALKMSNAEIVNNFPKGGQVRRMAKEEGIALKESTTDKKTMREELKKYMEQHGLRPERELIGQMVSQKVLRATYTKNQLQEVLTSFWFNHFNVSFDKNTCSQFIPAYERDVIRPNALGKFEDLLLATARSPAMLAYLDNFNSIGTNSTQQTRKNTKADVADQKKRLRGLNENYAREVMELHTLGVDGGYTQSDVTEAARILTGWTIYPFVKYGEENEMIKKLKLATPAQLKQWGIIRNGDFLFVPGRHDNDAKTVLGEYFPANGGYEEGVKLLTMLAQHPSTATYISKKIAIRFVQDNPPNALVERMSQTFNGEKGDIKKVLITMVSSPEFWNQEAVREKTKSPFELMISCVRALNATITKPQQFLVWATRMGEKFYFYQAPTGFPDKGSYWINTGSLLARMNFGLAIASNKVPGVEYDALRMNNGHEPESAAEALVTYSKLLLPDRNTEETIKRLSLLLNAPDLAQKVKSAANKTDTINYEDENLSTAVEIKADTKDQYNLHQVIGIILGSPEFQRR